MGNRRRSSRACRAGAAAAQRRRSTLPQAHNRGVSGASAVRARKRQAAAFSRKGRVMYEFQTIEHVTAAAPGCPPDFTVQRAAVRLTPEELIERLPKSADGVPITPGMLVY